MPKILGLDPGTATTGWGIIEKSGSNVKALKYGCINTDSKKSDAERLAIIYKQLSGIIVNEKPDQVAIEELFYFKNQKTVISVAEARGVLVVCSRNHEIPVFEYTPLQIKQALTGYGRADKKQMQEMVRITLKLKQIPHPDDAADALAVAVCHGQTNLRTEELKN